MAYVKFNQDSPLPQLVNFRELEITSRVQTSSPVSFTTFRSFKQVTVEDVINFPGVPVDPRTNERPESFIAVAEASVNSATGWVSWKGRAVPHSIILLPPEDMSKGGRGPLEILLTYLRGIGESIPVNPAIPKLQDIRLENIPPPVGQQSSTVFKLTRAGLESVADIQVQPQPQPQPPMQIEDTGGGGGNTGQGEMLMNQLQAQGQLQPNSAGSGRSFSNRATLSNYASPEVQQQQPLEKPREEELFPMKGENKYMTIPDFLASVEQDFDPTAIVDNIDERYTNVLTRNMGIRKMADWPNLKQLWGDTYNKVRAGVKLMSSGLMWIKALRDQLPKFYAAQSEFIPLMAAQEAAWDSLQSRYLAFEARMTKVVENYQNIGFPTEQSTNAYNEAVENLFTGRDIFEQEEAPIKRKIEALNERYLAKEKEFWRYTLNAYRYLRSIELALEAIRSELEVDSPVEIHGVDDKQTVTQDEYDDLVILHDPMMEEINQVDTSEFDEIFVRERYENQMRNLEEGEDEDF
ncbi:hypothetical protein AA313_de0210001 [Arthrobotrys entomopaga]|nr:hypothetical protein AA313_de0210001 [Arthrobotrys entomopaga]